MWTDNMATVGEAIAASIIAQWNVGTGGTKPDPIKYVVEDSERNPNSKVADAVFVWLPLRRKFDNDIDVAEKYRNVTYTIRIECHTKTSSARQLEIENEVDRILASGTVITGATKQKVLEINDISNRLYSVGAKFVSEILIEVFTAMEESATAYGTATATTLVTDTLTVNNASTLNGTTNIGDDLELVVGKKVIFDSDADSNNFIYAVHEGQVNIYVEGIETLRILQSQYSFRVKVNPNADGTIDLGSTGLRWKDFYVAGSLKDDTDSITVAQIADLLMFGNANAAYVPMTLEGASNFDHILVTSGRIHNRGADDIRLTFTLSMPTIKGGLKLHIKNLKFIVFDADANDKIDRVDILGWAATTPTTIDTDGTEHTSAGDKTFSGATMPAAAIDVSGYDVVYVEIVCVNTDAQALDITGVRMECYYDT